MASKLSVLEKWLASHPGEHPGADAVLKLVTVSTPTQIKLAIPNALPGQTIAQGAAQAAQAAGSTGTGKGAGKHVASALGVAHFKLPLGSLIIPHGKHIEPHMPGEHGPGGTRWVGGEPGHWVKGWITQEKWIANQWGNKPRKPGQPAKVHPKLASEAVVAGSHKWVQSGHQTVAAHHGIEVHVPKTTDLGNESEVRKAPKVLVHHHHDTGETEHALLQPQAGLGPAHAPSEGEKEALGKHWKRLPSAPSTKSVTFAGKHAATVPADWKVYHVPTTNEASLGGKWAYAPDGTWHVIHKNGKIDDNPGAHQAALWAKTGKLVPDEPEKHEPSPEHIVPQAAAAPQAAPKVQVKARPGAIKVDVGGVPATKHDILTAIGLLNAAQSTNVKGPLKSKGHPLAAMDYMAISKAELEKFPQLKISAGTKKQHTSHVKTAVLHHLAGKLDDIAKTEAEHAAAEKAKKDALAAAEHAAKLTPALKTWGGVEATKEQLAEAHNWLYLTMGGHGSFKQAMTKLGNPLAGADYMGAAKAYAKAHPNTAKGWSTKKLMLESITELEQAAAKEDKATGHDYHANIDHLLTKGSMKSGWSATADGGTAYALWQAANYKASAYSFLGPTPGLWDVSFIPPHDKGYMEATPDHKVIVHYTSGGSHEMLPQNVDDIVTSWLEAPEAEKPKVKTLDEVLAEAIPEKKPKLQPKLKGPEPVQPVMPKKKVLEGYPPKLYKFLKQGEAPGTKPYPSYDTLPKQIAAALLLARDKKLTLYVGQVPGYGEDAAHSWVYQFVKPSKGTYYMVDVMNVGGEWIPSVGKHEDDFIGLQMFNMKEIEGFIRGGKVPDVPAPPEPAKVHFTEAQLPAAEWAGHPDWPQIHGIVHQAYLGDVAGVKGSTDDALGTGLKIADKLEHDVWVVTKEDGTWSVQSPPPEPGSYGASVPHGYYKITQDHQIIQYDKEGNQTGLPGELVLQAAKTLQKKKAPAEMMTVLGAKFPAGSKVYKKDGYTARWVLQPTGTWAKVFKNGEVVQKAGTSSKILYEGWQLSGELKEVEPEELAGGIAVKFGDEPVKYYAPAGSSLWYDASGKSPADSKFTYVYIKHADNTWEVMSYEYDKPEPSANSAETLNAGIESGEMKPYGPEAEALVKAMSVPQVEHAEPPSGEQVHPAAADMPIVIHGEEVGKAPAGSKVYWYSAGLDSEEQSTALYVQHPDGSWWVYQKGHKDNGAPGGYNDYVKSGAMTLSGEKPKPSLPPEKPEPEKPAEKPKDIPVLIGGQSVGTVPGGTKFWEITDQYGKKWIYLEQPDGKWKKVKVETDQYSNPYLQSVYGNPKADLGDQLEPGHPPTPEQIAELEEKAAYKTKLNNGAMSPKDVHTWQAALVYHLTDKSTGYYGSTQYIWQHDNGTWQTYTPPAGKEHWKLNTKTLTAEHIIPPSPKNAEQITEQVPWEQVKAAIDEHLQPNSVYLGGKVYKHGYWYNPKGKAYLEIKAGGGYGSYYAHGKADYVWHQANGDWKDVTHNFAEKVLEKNTEYHSMPKPIAVVPGVVAEPKHASMFEPGEWNLYSSSQVGGVALDHLTSYGDGTGNYSDTKGKTLYSIPADAVDKLLQAGTILDPYGTTVVQPGMVPHTYHIFGSKGHSEAEVKDLLAKVEQADAYSWQQAIYGFFETGANFTGGAAATEIKKLFSAWWSDKKAVTNITQQASVAALLRELLMVPHQEAAKPFEVAYLKSMPEGIHSSQEVFEWTKNGWAKPFSGLLLGSWLDNEPPSPELGDKIKAISAEFGGGKVVGQHPASMTKTQKLAWLKAWKKGDMAAVFAIDSHTGKVSPVHPGAPKNTLTHQVSWSPLDPSQVPANMPVEGDWTATDVTMPKAEVNNYLIKIGFKNAAYLTEGQKMAVVKAHRSHDQDALDTFTKLANEKALVGTVVTPNPTWTEGLKPAKSYDVFVQESKAASDWTAKAVTDFIADHPDEMAPFKQQVLNHHGYSDWDSLPSYYQNEAIQSWLDDVHSKYVEEQSKPVWKKVPLGPTGSHGHAIFKYTRTIPYTGEVTTWYVKPAPVSSSSGVGTWRLEQEHAANSLGRLFGFGTAQSMMETIDGSEQLAIAEIQGKILGQYTDMPPWSHFTGQQIAELAAEHALDWVLANDDSSANNIIERPDGHLVGIDKGRSWGNMNWPGLAGDSSMDTMTGLAFTQLYDAIRSHEISKETADAAYTALVSRLRKMQAVPDSRVRAIMEAGFANRPKKAKFGDPEEIIAETIRRKNSLEEDFTKMWAKVYKEAGYAQAGPDPHAPGSAWGPIKGKPSYGVILFDDKGRIMLREPSNHFGGYTWTFSKGGADKGETPLQTAIRETAEETQLKASEVVGFVPGGFGGTSSTSYFYVGLKSAASQHPEMDNGETWNVKWVTPEEAKQLIAQSESTTGKARDLQILDAAFKAYAEAKKGGFEVTDSLQAATGLPYIPKAKLPSGPGGVALHAGFSEPEFLDHVAQAKSFGAPAFFGGTGLEYGHFIVWREFEGAGTDKPVIRGESGARGKSLHNLLAWAKAHVKGGESAIVDDTQTVYEGGEGFPGRAPETSADRGQLTGERDMYNKIITAARTVSRHVMDKKFNASAMQALDDTEEKLKGLLEGMEHIDPDNSWRKAAEPVVKQYLSYVAEVKNAKETAKTFVSGDLPRYLGPQKPAEKPKPTEVKVSLVSPWRPSTMATKGHALDPSDGELHTGSGHADFEAGSAKVYRLTLPTGEELDIWGGAENNVELAHRGHIKFKAVAKDGAASLERIRDQLAVMGMPLEEATPDDLELFYWRHLYGVLGDRKDGPNGTSYHNSKYASVVNAIKAAKKERGILDSDELEDAGLSPDEELGIWRAAWATITSEQQVEKFVEEGGHLPHLKHYNLHDPSVAGGRPVWMRFDVTRDMAANWKMPDHVFVTHPEAGAPRIVRSGGQYSKDFRFRHLGLELTGQGNGPDTGATDFVFGNLNSESGHVIVNPRLLAETQTYGWDGDNWGRLKYRHQYSWFDPEKAAAWHGMETMFPGAWTLLDDIEAVRAHSETQRKEIIDYLHNLGIYEIRGMPVEDRIGTSSTWSDTKKKVRANWAAHPELLDPHSEWSLATTGGAEAAEAGKTAAHVAAPPKLDAGGLLIADPANAVYTNADNPKYKYVKEPGGVWHIVSDTGKSWTYQPGSSEADEMDTMATTGELELLVGAGEGQGGLPTVDTILENPGNTIYIDAAQAKQQQAHGAVEPAKKYVKTENGDWYLIDADGQLVGHYPAGSSSSSDYNDLLDEGGLLEATAVLAEQLKPFDFGALWPQPGNGDHDGYDKPEYPPPTFNPSSESSHIKWKVHYHHPELYEGYPPYHGGKYSSTYNAGFYKLAEAQEKLAEDVAKAKEDIDVLKETITQA